MNSHGRPDRHRGKKRQRVHRQSGFTLLEAVVSLMILGIGVVAAIQLLSGNLRLAGAAGVHTDMVNVARERMSETILSGDLNEGVEKGESAGFRWTVEVSRFKNEDTPLRKRMMKVTVTAEDAAEEGRGFTLTTLKTVPIE